MPFGFKNPLKGLFKSAKDAVKDTISQTTGMSGMRTFVRFFTDDGAKFAEVQDRDVSKLTLPENTHHFKFFDRKLEKGEEPNTFTLFNGAENISPTHYVVDKVLTKDAYGQLPDDEKAKLTGAINEASLMAGAFVAIIGSETRALSPEENNVIAIDRKTLKQLWPAVADGPKSSWSPKPKR